MPQSAEHNRRYVLAERPQGLPDTGTLRLETGPVPTPGAGEVLLRTLYLSLDPYMRGRMSAAKSYADPVPLGGVMTGQVVAEVLRADHSAHAPGDLVLAGSGWQDYAVLAGDDLAPLGRDPAGVSRALGILGMPGYTAYAGLLFIGEPKPGETVVVAAATGPVGATVGQIARLKGCRVVGIASGAEKCAHATDTLGFDACIDRTAPGFGEALATACPDGIDVYFENVGGAVLYAVLPLLNPYARVPVCGVVSWYNLTGLPEGPDHGPMILSTILKMRLKFQGFIIFESFPKETYQDFRRDMTAWIDSGDILYREQMVDGLEAAPAALNAVLTGQNFGKMVVRVGHASGA